MIRMVLGQPGSGKTLYALWAMGACVAAGRRVATNIALTKACPFQDKVVFLDGADWPFIQLNKRGEIERAFWQYMPAGFVYFWDEVDNDLDASDFSRNNASTELRLYFKQHAKRGDDLFLIAQNLDNVWVRVRRMAARYIVCEYTHRTRPLLRWLPRSFGCYLRGEFGHESMTPRTYLGSGHFTIAEAERMFGWYDRCQFIGAAAGIKGLDN